MRKLGLITCLAWGSAFGVLACDGGGGHRLDPIPLDTAERACAAFGACLGVHGTGDCVEMLSQIHLWDPEDMSALLAFNDDADWVPRLALIQNADCAASATTCEAVLACLNGGEAERDCTPPATSANDAWCQDGDVLLDCSGTGLLDEHVQTRLSCADLGLQCLEVSFDGLQAGFCANGTSEVDGETVQVTCDGSVALIEGFSSKLRLECAFNGLTCQAGSFEDLEFGDFCVPGGPACDPQTAEDHCDGDRVIGCEDERETSLDCARLDQTCGVVQVDTFEYTTCVYGSCSPTYFSETCVEETGVITYCGPGGVVTLDCKALGYASCLLEFSEARCVD